MNERFESILDVHRAMWPGCSPQLLDSIKSTRSCVRKGRANKPVTFLGTDSIFYLGCPKPKHWSFSFGGLQGSYLYHTQKNLGKSDLCREDHTNLNSHLDGWMGAGLYQGVRWIAAGKQWALGCPSDEVSSIWQIWFDCPPGNASRYSWLKFTYDLWTLSLKQSVVLRPSSNACLAHNYIKNGG